MRHAIPARAVPAVGSGFQVHYETRDHAHIGGKQARPPLSLLTHGHGAGTCRWNGRTMASECLDRAAALGFGDGAIPAFLALRMDIVSRPVPSQWEVALTSHSELCSQSFTSPEHDRPKTSTMVPIVCPRPVVIGTSAISSRHGYARYRLQPGWDALGPCDRGRLTRLDRCRLGQGPGLESRG